MNLRYSIPLFVVALAHAQSQLTLRVVTEAVAPGGWAQIKVYADSPKLISKGTLSIDLDPQVFGPIESIAAFSAAGDVAGLASVSGNHVTASLTAPSGGLGQLPGVPVFAVRAPVLVNAPRGGYIALSLPPTPLIRTSPNLYPQDAWTDATARPYTTTLLSANVPVGGTASIRDVSPQGFQPAGAVLHVDGTGFSPSTQIRADGVSFSSMFVSPTRIDLTLNSSVELTGVRFVTEEPGRTVEFFSSVPSTVTAQSPSGALPPIANHIIFPIAEGTTTSNSHPTSSVGSQSILYNPTPSPIDIRVKRTGFGSSSTSQFQLPPGVPISYDFPGSLIQQTLESDTPFRAVAYFVQGPEVGGARAGITTSVPSISLLANAASQRPGPIAPGEFITLRGTGLGTVSFNNIAAPVLYSSSEQRNVIVPYELEGAATATVKVSSGGVDSKTWTVAVNPAAPGIFTLDATGVGRGAILNQDNTVNAPDNVAPVGTIIQIFATGGGQSNPASTTGSVTPITGGGSSRLPVKVFFAETTEATVVFAGPAPGFASGALQVNAVVPPLGVPGQLKPTAAVTLEINGVRSAPVTVAIR